MGERRHALCLAGDVMLGRAIDQIQAHPGDPRIYESWAQSSVQYVELAERESGAIPRSVDPTYVWGELLPTLRDAPIEAFIVNLETAVTDDGRPWPAKGIHYRMNPANSGILTAGRVDVVTLANNHVLDWSEPGLVQTIDTLRTAAIHAIGAGEDRAHAWTPVRLDLPDTGLVVLGVGTRGSGIPDGWEATDRKPGVALLPDFSDRTIEQIADAVSLTAGPGDLVVLSIHWGGNWGYGVSTARRRFARRLIDEAGVDVIHGHSSHHPTGIEVYHGRLILYGCGDLINDYEGITGRERFRGDLGGLYLTSFSPDGRLAELTIVPSRMRRFQLTSPSASDRTWLASELTRAGKAFGTSVRMDSDGNLVLAW